MAAIFISYRRDDAAGYAGRLHEALEQRFGGGAVFRDVETLVPGQDFAEAIAARLGQCRVFLAVIGREWLDAKDSAGRRRLDRADDYVRLEIAGALAQPQVRVIPVLIEGATVPLPELLPDDIRPLTRRHAVSLRDDAWEHDVGRLAAAITGIVGNPASAAGRSGRRLLDFSVPGARKRALMGAAAVLTAIALVWLTGGQDGGGTSNEADAPAAKEAVASATASRPDAPAGGGSPPTATGGAAGSAYAVPIPTVAEAVHGSLIYTIVSASVVPLDGATGQLRLRVRFTNEGRYDANAWDSSFRLVADRRTFAPNSGLNELAPSQSSIEGIVTFTIPANIDEAVLRILSGDRVAELPLAVARSGRPAQSEQADAGGELSHARVREVVNAPRHVVKAGEWDLTVERATSRRFVNALRVRFVLRLTNRGRYPAGLPTVRLAAGARVVAPLESPTLVVAADADGETTAEFEVPPNATEAVLRVSAGEIGAELPLTLQ